MAARRSSQSISFLAHNSAIIGITMSTTLIFAFATLYLREVVQVSNVLVGLAISLSHVISVVMSPVAGSLSDAARTPWGRRRPFLIVGATLAGVCLVVLGRVTDYWLYLGVLSLFFMFSVGYQIPFYALIPEVAPEGQRGRYTIFTGLLRFLGFGIVMVFGAWFWRRDPAWPFYLTGIAVILTALITTLTVREDNHEHARRLTDDIHWLRRTKRYLKDLAGYKPIMIFFAAQFFWWLGLGALLPFATIMMKEFYGVDVSQLFRMSPLAVGAGLLLAVSVVVAGIVGDRWGHRQVIMVGLGFVAVGGGLAFFVRSIYAVYGVAALMAVGSSPLLNEPLALLAEMVPKGREGEFYGLDTISITLSQVPAALIGGAVIDAFGHAAVFLVLTASVVIAAALMLYKARFSLANAA